MKSKTLHMIGNAHIDPVWLWQWQEGFHEVHTTFRSALDRMNEDPDFKFTASSAVFYAWVEESDPDMFAEIRQRVMEGRWGLAGGWWIEPDCNIPSGESFARHALYAQRFFKEKFGITAHYGYAVDSFGHNAMLPQLLKKGGMPGYVFMRPHPHEKGLPARLFWWESDDGSRVLAYRLPFEYGGWGGELVGQIQRVAGELQAPYDEAMCFYGVGDHGGGPTKENLASIHRLSQDPDGPELIMSTPEAFFASVSAKNWPLPVVHDDLQHHASGCYAAHSGIKAWNRRAESLLAAAEKAGAVALVLTGRGGAKPGELEHAWKNVLFNQFHDVMAGTCIEPAYDDARQVAYEALSIGGWALNSAVQAIAWGVQNPEQAGVRPILVFNSHAWPVHTPVELEIGPLTPEDILLDDQGQRVPMQSVQSNATAGMWRNRLCFLADLPALGYRLYLLVPSGGAQEAGEVAATETTLDNGRLRLEIDPTTGCIASLQDLEMGEQVFSGPAARPVVIEDTSDTWSHAIFRFDQVAGEFDSVSVRRMEHGPVRSTLRVTSSYGSSRLVQDFILYRGLKQVEVRVTVDWHEQFKLLKLRFPVSMGYNFKAVTEIPYGHLEHFTDGEEEPMQSWVDISGFGRSSQQPYGFSLLNDAKYSLDMHLNEIGLTVLRSPIYAHHTPAAPNMEAEDYRFIDQGEQRFTYVMQPHAGSWETAGTVRRAAELNQPPVALQSTFHPNGSLPQSDSFIAVDQDNINVTVFKPAEDGGAWVLRAYETAGSATHVSIDLPKIGRILQADFKPCEIKTLRIPFDAAAPVVEVDFMEWDLVRK